MKIIWNICQIGLKILEFCSKFYYIFFTGNCYIWYTYIFEATFLLRKLYQYCFCSLMHHLQSQDLSYILYISGLKQANSTITWFIWWGGRFKFVAKKVILNYIWYLKINMKSINFQNKSHKMNKYKYITLCLKRVLDFFIRDLT